jgi:PKD repeat protein
MFVNFNKIKLILPFCFWGIFIFGNFISVANENNIVINEIAAFEPSGYEWIEIYNTTNSEIDLTDWRFIEGFSESDEDGVSHKLNSFNGDSAIKSKGYAIIAQDAEKFLGRYEISSDIIVIDSSWGSLNEKGEKIALKDSDGNIIESFTYFPCPENSLERINPELKDYSADNWRETAVETPGKENSVYLISKNSETNESGNEENLENEDNQEKNRALIADAGGDMEIFVNQEIEFDASDSSDSDGGEISFSWDFGDGKNGQGINPIHFYNTAGEFKVILTVNDGDLSSTDSLIVKVIETSYSRDIVINEILPNPKGIDTAAPPGGEWIELYNQSNQKINLAGWKLDDLISSGSKPHTIDSEIFIEPNGYLIFYYEQTKICLNNNGDEVNLINPQEKIISTCSYQEESAEQTSLALGEDNNYYWSVEPTPNKENLISVAESENFEEDEIEEELGENFQEDSDEENEENLGKLKENPKEANISEAKKIAKGIWVRIRGTVSAPPKILSDKVFYVSSEESGIQIYSSKGDFPELNSGDFVEIIGKTSEANNEKKINIYSADDVEILDADFPPEPKIIKTGEINETVEGSLVKIEGQVSRSAGNVFYVDDGSGEIKIYIRSATGIKKPKTSKGTWATIAGIASETSAGYRILPRFQEDVLVGKVAGSNILPQAGADLFFIFILSLTGLLILIKRKIICHFLSAEK